MRKSSNILDLPPYVDMEEKNPLFEKSLKEALIHHYDNNSYYKKFCEKKDFNPRKFRGNYSKIPYIQVNTFKSLEKELISVESKDIKTKVSSSATSGIPSKIFLDTETVKRQALAMAKVMSNFIGKEKKEFLILDIEPIKENIEILGARMAALRGYLNFSKSSTYFVNVNENRSLEFASNEFVKKIKSLDPKKPIILFGFTYVVYEYLIKFLKSEGAKISLPKGSILLHIGGWKKLEDEKIPKEKFNKTLSKALGINVKDIIDVYGFTEQMGINYPDCKCGCGYKPIPSYSKVIVRDPKTHEVLENGQPGLLQFISPIAKSYPGNSILTDDIGLIEPSKKVCSEKKCELKFDGDMLKIIGRAKKAEIRGCGDVMGEKIISNNIDQANFSSEESLKVFFHKHKIGKLKKSSEILQQIISANKSAKEWMNSQSVDDLIGLIDLVRHKWMEPNFKLANFEKQGLSFLHSWCSRENLENILNISCQNSSNELDIPVKSPSNPIKYLYGVPKGTVVHWLSGNVPVLGMLVLVQSIISKNTNLLKASSDYSDAIPILLESFSDEVYVSPGGTKINGNDLLKSISIIYYNRDEISLAKQLSAAADVRVGWGSADAVTHVSSLPKKWNTEDLIFGPKLSCMVLSSEAFKTGRIQRRIIRRASVDCSAFDQTACASPHTIFIEKNKNISLIEFAELLNEEMYKTNIRNPAAKKDKDLYAYIQNVRSEYDYKGDYLGDDDLDFTILMDDESGLAKPHYGRVITLREVESIFDVLNFIDSDIQTIGFYSEGKKKIDFAKKALDAGVERLPDVGFMTNFDNPWDGYIAMHKFIRWGSIGGP